MLPNLFLDRVQHILPPETDLNSCFNPRPCRAFRINALKAQPQEVHAYLEQLGIHPKPIPWYPLAFAVEADAAQQVLGCPLVSQGKIYAQGLESMLPVFILDPQPGEVVLDLCAAPGSKTTQIAAHMRNEGTLVANEPVRGRFFRLKAVTELLGANVRLMMSDGRFLRQSHLFDRVLVDAPCSSEGRFLSTDEKTWSYWSLRKIHEMAHKQKGLLLNAGRLVKPGGTLVYATCTFAPEENEAVIDYFLRRNEQEFKVEAIKLPEVESYPCLATYGNKEFDPMVNGCLRVLPNGRMEGFFVAKMTRAI
jgi:NOL1/NOP2/sun family putative RNA methylase